MHCKVYRRIHKQGEVLGVNYEGHKITRHALARGALCVLNMQIAMDAPFLGEPAGETTRAKGMQCKPLHFHMLVWRSLHLQMLV